MNCILYVLLMNDLPDALETLAVVFADDVKVVPEHVIYTNLSIPIVLVWDYHEPLLEYVFIIFKFLVYYVTENVNQDKMKSFETFNQWMIRRWNKYLRGCQCSQINPNKKFSDL